MTFDGETYTCDYCGKEIERVTGYDWVGPNPAPGEPQKRYHAAKGFPECRARSGVDDPAGLPLSERLALTLADEFTTPGPNGKLPQFRVDQGMMRHFLGPDGFPAMTPVTPREVAAVVERFLRGVRIAS